MAKQNEIVADVSSRIMSMQAEDGLKLPSSYSVGNALQSAWLILSDANSQKDHIPLLEKTSRESQAKALLNMVIQGLSPAKNQVYFIPYGQELTLTRSYFGSLAILKRLDTVQDVWAEVIHEKDAFQLANVEGRTVVAKFEPLFENQDNALVGAFAVIVDANGVKNYTVMTKKQIEQSWSHAKTHNVQKEFPEEMAKRTVLNRAAKFFINSSGDNDLFVGAVNETTADEYDDKANRRDVSPVASVSELTAPVDEANEVVGGDDKHGANSQPEPIAGTEQGELLHDGE